LLLIHVIAGALTVVSTYVLVAVGLRMVFKLRCALFDHIQRLSLRFHDSTTIGDSLYRVAWDSYAVQSIFNTGAGGAAAEWRFGSRPAGCMIRL
jgi:ATP-binding cassette subfamily B protein